MNQKSKLVLRFFVFEILPIFLVGYSLNQNWSAVIYIGVFSALVMALNIGRSIYDGDVLGSGGIIYHRKDSSFNFWFSVAMHASMVAVLVAITVFYGF